MISGIHHRVVMIALLLAGSLCASSQNLGVSFKRLFLDYQTFQGGDFGAFKDYRNGFEFGVHIPVTQHLMVNVPFKMGLSNKTNEITNQYILGVDAQAHLYFLPHPDRYKPYGLAGVGGVYTRKDSSINFQVPVGLGVDIRIAPNAYFNIQSEFRW
ncbi:MAG: outer membrane beta-barrel protein, partial [Saprospiraceae bacterium]